jgi:hypothetical protein
MDIDLSAVILQSASKLKTKPAGSNELAGSNEVLHHGAGKKVCVKVALPKSKTSL